MTIAEFIKVLKKHDQNATMEVCIDYDGIVEITEDMVSQSSVDENPDLDENKLVIWVLTPKTIQLEFATKYEANIVSAWCKERNFTHKIIKCED